MEDTLSFAHSNAAEGKKVALATVTKTSGSSPATPGQMIAVLADGSTMGTIGGGASEHHVITLAVDAIKNGESVFSFSFDHTKNGMICGGNMEGFGNVIGNQARLCIFGGGHIAQSLSRLAVKTGFYVTIIEDRPEFEVDFESVKYTVYSPNEYSVTRPAAHEDYAVICTRGHSTDDEALRYCLTEDLKYIGMIGSKTKVTSLLTKLREEGVSKEALERLYAPIGLDIACGTPPEISVAILAEILLIKNNGTLTHKKLF